MKLQMVILKIKILLRNTFKMLTGQAGDAKLSLAPPSSVHSTDAQHIKHKCNILIANFEKKLKAIESETAKL